MRAIDAFRLARGLKLVAAAVALLIASTPASAKCTLGQMLEMPVTMVNRQPVVTVGINGKPIQLVADSGAFYSNLTPGAAADLGLKPRPLAGFFMGGIGGSTQASVATVKTFKLGKLELHDIQFLVGGSEIGASGLLGQNVLGVHDVEYDLANGVIRLFRTRDCGGTTLAYWAKPRQPYSVLPIEEANEYTPHTVGTVLLNGVRIKAVFDTGAGTTILTDAAAARAGIKPDSPGVTDSGYAAGLGRQVVRTWIGAFDSLKIGDEEIKKIHLRFGRVGDGSFDMLIGADFFLSHRVFVANSRKQLYFTYNGGPVFDLSRRTRTNAATTAEAKPPEPAAADDMDASTLARRGASQLARNDVAGALASLDRAIELAPNVAEYRLMRARIHARNRARARQLADLDQALTLDPKMVDALLMRADLRLDRGNDADARLDLDAASAQLGDADDRRHALAGYYGRADALDEGIAQYSRWIAVHPQDSALAGALNGRCWLRALAGKDLAAAVGDCNRSLKLRPNVPSVLDSRGLAYLRAGDDAKALASYDAALKIEPDIAWSHYGRGIIELRRGQKEAGEADLAAARKSFPGIDEKATRYGIKPP